MADYKAKQGQEDRHGEITGGISVNMVLVFLPLTIWCAFLGPWLFASVWPTLVIGLALAVVLTIACRPLSHFIWAHISEWMDRSRF